MELIAEPRTKFGKQSKSIRKARGLPAVMFARNMDSVPLILELQPFIKIFNEAGESVLVDLKTPTQKEKVLIREVQFHPITGLPIHVCLQKVDLKEKITTEIPIEITGEENNILIKGKEALLLTLIDALTVEALPTDLPKAFKIDVSNIKEIGDGIAINQLEYDKTKIEILGHHEEDDLIVKLDYAEMAEEKEEEINEAEAIAKVEATGELSPEEKAKRAEEAKSEKTDKKD